jgi:hypothetical protein
MFHEFIESWVGYELLKVFRAYGLQPRSLHPKLKHWSPDLFDVFTYLENKSALNKKQQNNAKRIIEVLINRTKHNGHFAKVQFGSKRNFMATQNFKLSLIVLTWQRQLQQYFLHSKMATSDNGDWNNIGIYCGTTSNPMAKYVQKNCHPMIRTSLIMFHNSNWKKENMECVHFRRNGLFSS